MRQYFIEKIYCFINYSMMQNESFIAIETHVQHSTKMHSKRIRFNLFMIVSNREFNCILQSCCMHLHIHLNCCHFCRMDEKEIG